jgi:hypothetical protein
MAGEQHVSVDFDEAWPEQVGEFPSGPMVAGGDEVEDGKLGAQASSDLLSRRPVMLPLSEVVYVTRS